MRCEAANLKDEITHVLPLCAIASLITSHSNPLRWREEGALMRQYHPEFFFNCDM